MKLSSALPRWIFSVLGILSLVFVFASVSPATMAQQQAAPAAQEPVAAKVSSEEGLPPLPMSPVERAQKDGTALPLSLRDLTKLALQNNLDIAIQDTNELLQFQKIKSAQGPYDPKLTGSAGLRSQKNPVTSYTTAAQGGLNQTDSITWDFQFQQSVKTGGNYSARWNSGRSDNNSTQQTFNPQYTGSATLQFTQPLWKNFRIDSNRANIKIVNLDLKTSDSQFKQKVTTTISDIQTQYWTLVSAIRDYDIKRRSVRLAQIQLRDNKKKVEVGTLAPIDVTDAEATLASREVSLITSEETILSQENALRALISNNRSSEVWSQVIVPTDTPDFREYKVDMDEAITTALRNRPEIEQSDLTLAKADINRKIAENDRKWDLSLVAQYLKQGIAGPQAYQKDPLTGLPLLDEFGNPKPSINPNLVGGLGTAYKTVFSEGFRTWSVTLNFTIPLGNKSADAAIAQRSIEKRQELMRRKQTEQNIQVDVRNAVQQIQTRKKQVETAGASKRFSQERLDGEVKRFDAGLSQNYLVLQRQNELAQAEYDELQSLINYKRAIINLQKAMYTLLESGDFEIAKGSSDVPEFK